MSTRESYSDSSSDSVVGLFDNNGKNILVRNKPQNVSVETKYFLIGSLASPTEAYSYLAENLRWSFFQK